MATLATGTWPAQHGIVADHWYERSIINAVPASDEGLLAGTLMGEVAAAPRTRVAVVASTRERAALFAGTPEADLYWIDPDGNFMASGEPPDWLSGFTSPNGAEAVHDVRWLAVGAKPDAPALRTLNWSAARPQEFMALYRSSPFEQAAVFDFAAEVVAREKLGQTRSFDVLCILPAAMEQLGYETGAHSPLMQQMALQLDRRLEQFFDQLAKGPGEGAYNFALAAAHGAPREPLAAARGRMAVHGEPLAQAIQKSLMGQNLPGVVKYIYPFLYLKTEGLRDPEPLRLAAGRAALAQPAVAGYYTAGGACSVHDEWERRFRNSFHVMRSGDVMISYRPGYVESYGEDRGVSYGSLYNYDARVPLLFYGPQFRAGIFEQTVEAVDFAPTLARAAGVAPPSSAVGRVLGEALVE